jgi:hypothetical protein
VGILEILTAIFIILKLIGTIDWSWWLVLLPEIVAVVLYVGWTILVGSVVINRLRKFK